jgi:CubicO group peptidase (beta-lactamase class C family)
MLAGLRNGGWAIQLEAHGNVDEGFASVVDSFLDGFTGGRDVGASLAVYLEGQPVINLHAGFRDRRKTKPWENDTLCCLFSMSKGITAICLLQAVADGLIDLDRPVAEYWDGFAENGKEVITTRHILSHQSGLVGFHSSVPREFLYDWPAVAALLADESPWWPPGEQHGYHARTFGFLLGEILHRVSGKTVGEWVKERLVVSGDGEFMIGLSEAEMSRCADMVTARLRAGEAIEMTPERREMMSRVQDLSTPTGAAFQNPSLGPSYMNSTAFRAAQIPAMNGHGTALGVASIYSRITQLIEGDLLQEATRVQSEGKDLVLRSYSKFGLGFMLYDPKSPIGLKVGSFGHAGAGGSMAFYDPDRRLAFCFVMNQMQEGVVTGGTSAMQVAQSVYDCLS